MAPAVPTSALDPLSSRNSVGTKHEMESDDKDNESVPPDNTNGVIWEVRNP